MNKWRILNRIVFHIFRKVLVFISLFNHRLFMSYYIPLLKNNGMKINGLPRYIGVNVKFDDFDHITLGDRVVISDKCHFLTHDYSFTTAMIAIGKKPQTDIALIRNINVGDNVFIGKSSIILPNTSIGNNVIIGAGSVVRGNICDNSVVIGNPCQVIGEVSALAGKWEKYFDSDSIRKDLKQ